MSRRKNIRSKQLFDEALTLEKSGDYQGALKLYAKATTTDPLNTHGWNRQMLLYRKTKTRHQEVELIQAAISEYGKSIQQDKQQWLAENRQKADSTRELAQVLGLLEPTGLPKSDDPTLEKWQTRLYLLEYRIKNARKNKTKTKKPVVAKTTKKKPTTKTKKAPSKKPPTKPKTKL